MRPSGRAADQLREITLEPHFSKYAEGSCLVRFGDTHVLCNATLEDRVPPFMRNSVEVAADVTADDQLATDLIAHARKHLAHYKCPRQIDIVEVLPRHDTGKIYRRLVREPYWAGRDRRI